MNGWRETLPLAFAPLMSDAPIIVALIILVNLPNQLLQIMQLAGGLIGSTLLLKKRD
ncbi:MAG: hypothetical protein Q8S01_05965 [Ignavibacteria bacterium]|nr:hypothetical protein [Ignavibacteria bacterium]